MVSIIAAIKSATAKSYSHVPSPHWWTTITEPFTGAWQQNIEWRRDTVLAHHAVFACITLIASDISKLKILLVKEKNGIWDTIPFGDFRVIDKPNDYQNRIQFIEFWLNSKLTRGNTYVYKTRDTVRGKVTGLYILCPDLVLPLVSDSGDVFYQLGQDNLTGLKEGSITVPASEIIHDRFNCLFHPLVGLPPIFASGLAAYQGLKIQENSAKFFKNMSRPSGILTAPGAISDETATRLKATWELNYSAEKMGGTAVLGDGLEYKPMSISFEQSEMVDQLRITAEMICSTFHVPKYKVIGEPPSFNNIEALESQYYSQCLQRLIEDIELCLDIGLGIPEGQGTEFDLDGLLRMDSTALYDANTKAVGGGWMKPDEARRRVNMHKVEGGNTPYLQVQNYSLAALAKRDAKEDPFAKDATAQAPASTDTAPFPDPEPDDDDQERQMLELGAMLKREIEGIQYA